MPWRRKWASRSFSPPWGLIAIGFAYLGVAGAFIWWLSAQSPIYAACLAEQRKALVWCSLRTLLAGTWRDDLVVLGMWAPVFLPVFVIWIAARRDDLLTDSDAERMVEAERIRREARIASQKRRKPPE